MPAPSRVFVVDDSAVVRRTLSRIIAEDPSLEVAGTAGTGAVALDMIPRAGADVVVLDVEMPGMGGLEVLERLRKARPGLPVIMFSACTPRSATDTIEALARGATDFVLKPAGMGDHLAAVAQVRTQLIDKIRFLFGHARPTPPSGLHRAVRHAEPGVPAAQRLTPGIDVVAVGCSTGGPNALSEFLGRLPEDLDAPVVVAQHMPPLFTASLAKRLDRECGLAVAEGVHGTDLRPGTAWIAPGDHHMTVRRGPNGYRIHLEPAPESSSVRPSVDRLFDSLAEHCGHRCIAVVMTGMGQDGLAGSRRIHGAGGQVLIQDKESSVVWGMPGAVAGAGLAGPGMSPAQLAYEVQRRVDAGARRDGTRAAARRRRRPR